MKETVLRSLAAFGMDLRKFKRATFETAYFLSTVKSYRAKVSGEVFKLRLRDLYPVLTDRCENAGAVGGHYFYQDLWAARKIFERRPEKHFDVGSRIDGFIAHLLTFMPVAQVDIRPLSSSVRGLTFVQDDATRMDSFPNDSIDSLSSLHVIEHFGLGRYGDPVDPDSWKQAAASFARVLRPGGRLYLSTPIGRERLEFNAHRILSPESVLNACAGLQLISFASVLDDGSFVEGISPRELGNSAYACGLFEMTK
jgi:SAM-dependent methyltransferase